MESGCLCSGDSKREKRIQRQGLGYVRAGRGHVGTVEGNWRRRSLFQPLPCHEVLRLLPPCWFPQFPHLAKE